MRSSTTLTLSTVFCEALMFVITPRSTDLLVGALTDNFAPLMSRTRRCDFSPASPPGRTRSYIPVRRCPGLLPPYVVLGLPAAEFLTNCVPPGFCSSRSSVDGFSEGFSAGLHRGLFPWSWSHFFQLFFHGGVKRRLAGLLLPDSLCRDRHFSELFSGIACEFAPGVLVDNPH